MDDRDYNRTMRSVAALSEHVQRAAGNFSVRAFTSCQSPSDFPIVRADSLKRDCRRLLRHGCQNAIVMLGKTRRAAVNGSGLTKSNFQIKFSDQDIILIAPGGTALE
jgi:hypothetical protein